MDDGAPDLAVSIKMARMAAEDSITHVVCTPHANSRYRFDPTRIAASLTQLREALAEAGIRLVLGNGCDFHLSYDNVRDALDNPHRYTINGGEYLLVELPDYALPPTLEETFYSLRLSGMTPILTHPERNPSLQQDASRLADWVRDGMLTQVTAASVTGLMGRKAQKLAERLLAMAPVPMSKVFFANSGSEANDTAVKLVWYYHNAIGKPEKNGRAHV